MSHNSDNFFVILEVARYYDPYTKDYLKKKKESKTMVLHVITMSA